MIANLQMKGHKSTLTLNDLMVVMMMMTMLRMMIIVITTTNFMFTGCCYPTCSA